MTVCNYMNKLPCFHITGLRDHHQKKRILAHIPVICRQNILRSLIQNSIQDQFVFSRFFGHIKCHGIGTWVKIHFMKILMYINIGHDPSAVRIVLKIKKYPVHLIHHSFFILMFHTQLIAVGFSDGAVLICPAVPDMAVKIMDIVGFLLPDPQNLIHGTL